MRKEIFIMTGSTDTIEEEHKHKEGEDLIHLYIDEKNLGDSVAPIRWCICKEIFDKLKEMRAEKPYLLLVVACSKKKNRDDEHKEEYEEVSRKLVPLEQMMDFIQFKGVGKHKILANILWTRFKSANLRAEFLSKNSYGNYRRYLLDEYKGKLHNLGGIEFEQIGNAELNVDVSEEFFAKEPPKWLKDWVNWFYSTLPVDQCKFRRRCILAFTIQPVVVLLCTIFLVLGRALLALLFLLCGVRNINFKPIFHPWKNDTGEMLEWYDGSTPQSCSLIFLRDKDGNKHSPFLIPLVVVGPVFAISLATLFILIWFGVSGLGSLNIWSILLISIVLAFGAFSIVLLVMALVLLISFLCDKLGLVWLINRIGKLQEEWEVRKREFQEENYKQRFSPIICPQVPLEANLSAIPVEKKTIYLRFMDLKRKVCRPFARY